MEREVAWESAEPVEEAEFVVGADGTVEEANDVGLRLLGVTLDELRAAPAGTFSAPVDRDEQAALRRAWVEQGAIGAVGVSEIRRRDGQTVRVRYITGVRADARYVIAMRPIDAPVRPSVVLATATHALAAWRSAQRRLEVLEPGTPDWQQAQADVASFREQYRRLFDAARHA